MENKDIVVQEKNSLTAKEIKAQVNLIQSVMEAVMKDGVHYGKIPGCGEKPTLLKPGAEKIMATFRLAADPHVEDLSIENIVRYRVTVRLLSLQGNFVGAGIGECSSEEEKYHWKKAVCQEEFDATPEDQRREKWIKGYKGEKNYQVKQIMTNKADVANTVLKMAKKRALIDAVLTATAASDIFNQDLEDMPPELAEQLVKDTPTNGKPKVEEPKEKTNAPEEIENAKPGEIGCSSCGVAITPAEKEYSEKKFKKALCRNCQRKVKVNG